MKNFADLTEREVLAVAISAEEEDSRIYMTFAEDLAERYPESAKIFEEMAEEEKAIATCCWKCTSSVSAATFRPFEEKTSGDFCAAVRSG